MATPEEQAESTEQAFKRLADKGHEWPSIEQLALQTMFEDQDYRRTQRSKLANSLRDLLALDRRRSKPSLRYRQQTELGMTALDQEGRLERRFIDDDGQLHETPMLPPSLEDVRYRLLPPQAQDASFGSVVGEGMDAPSEPPRPSPTSI
ncbi:MAG TPA: hypothetical protein VHA37_03850 [Candidatus Saccharimonadales bacterium]|nr:hypothetical protein [Candidatus Saccharimonadales bacterium]